MCFGIYFERGCACFCHSGPARCDGACCDRPGEAHVAYKYPEGDFFAGEMISKMAGGPRREHKFRFRRRNFEERKAPDILYGDRIS